MTGGPALRHALALCAIYDRPPRTCASLLLLPGEGEVRLCRHPGAAGAVEAYAQGGDLLLLVPDAFMSSHHAVLRRAPPGGTHLCVEDLGSRNGTRLCGLPLHHGSRPLRHGDLIETGRSLWRFLDIDASTAARRDDDLHDEVLAPLPLQPLPHVHNQPGTLSPPLRRLLATAQRLGAAAGQPALPALILGEPGSGKTWLAHLLHEQAQRPRHGGQRGPLRVVPPGGRLPPPRELEMHGGTLLVEEVGQLSALDQSDLLRLLRGEPGRAGRPRPEDAPPRVLATSDLDLVAMARGGSFRPDLLSHLSAITLSLPPLRERKEDLGLLAESCLHRQVPDAPLTLSADAWRCLFAHEWPGNLSELRRALQHATQQALCAGRGEIVPADLPLPGDGRFTPSASRPPGAPAPEKARRARVLSAPPAPLAQRRVTRPARPPAAGAPVHDEARRLALVGALQAEDGKVARAARRLGLSRVHVHRLAKQLGINPDDFRKHSRG